MADRDSWCTPQYIVDAALEFFGGPPDLDPCSNEHSLMPAKRKIMLPEDGLAVDWGEADSLWMNCPYSNPRPWATKWRASVLLDISHGIGVFKPALSLVKLDPSTRWWLHYRGLPTVLLSKRVRHEPPPGVKSSSPSFPSAVVGTDARRMRSAFGHLGTVMVAA